jgi:hypothetical protein
MDIHLGALLGVLPICLQSCLHDTQKKYGFVLGRGTSMTTIEDDIKLLIMCE